MTIKGREYIIFVLVSLLFLCTKSIGANNIVSYCIEKERLALLDLKAGLVDDFGRLSTWSSEELHIDCCKWSGVHCNNRTGHVIELHLGVDADRPLRGKISPSLLEIPYLNHLDLSNNDFEQSPIPKFIGSLTKLKHLNLSLSNFAGTIPYQFGNLSNLHYLSLSYSGNITVENLEWMSHLSHLEHLEMDRVDLSKEIRWVDILMRLPSLSYLSLSGCQLNDFLFPYDHSLIINSSSTSIITLDLSYNNLTSSMYHWLFNVSNNLVNLFISFNQLKGPIPEAFGNITSLSNLDLSFNQLQGVIPKSFGNMVSLSKLDLSYNQLQGMIPKSLGNLCNLKSLYLTSNMLSGTLVDFVDNLSRCPEVLLEELDVCYNNLTGPFPDNIKRLLSLKKLSFCSNRLNGNLTENLGELTKLQRLNISSNSLEGVVSEVHFSKLSNLTHLDMSLNHLTLKFNSGWVPPFQLEFIYLRSCKLGPHFPRWIQTQKNFYILDISDGEIVDTIPVWLWDLSPTRLRSLNLSSNKIRGTVPDLSSKMVTFSMIDLSFNHFEGLIPLFPSGLLSLNLSRNKFSGALSFLCQIVDGFLAFLDLSQNFLTGDLPDCLSLFPSLVVLNLAHNKLSGKIPMSVGSLVQLEVLNLYKNNFHGELPLTLRNCTTLSFLNLGANKLSGDVPGWIGENLYQLYGLSLRSNNFFGTIPLHICQLTDLRFLDLSMNHLSGTIPSCLNNFTSMVQNGRLVKRTNHPYLDVYSAPDYVDFAIVGWQGREVEFGNNLRLLTNIDLSSNNLNGEIPDEITGLFELISLNLSRNLLQGKIPQKIGQLKALGTLDLSRNRLSGEIPLSMSGLSLLNDLDVSHNNLSGRIPSSTQLQSFDASKYTGNFGLCGPPLATLCRGDEYLPTIGGSEGDPKGKDEFWKWFEIGAGSGFVTGFWGVCGALFLNCRWRHAIFLFLDSLKDWIFVTMAMSISKLRRFRM